MPSAALATPTSLASKSVSLQCAQSVISPSALSEAPTPTSDRTRVLDNFADALFVQGRLDRVGLALASVQSSSKSAHKYKSKHFYFPARALALLQPGRGYAVLPSGSPELVELWRFYCQQLGLRPEQAVWVDTGDASLDEAAARDCAVATVARLTRSLIAYADRTPLREFAMKHGLAMPCDSDSWRLERGNKVSPLRCLSDD
jgi:hypothetical protein